MFVLYLNVIFNSLLTSILGTILISRTFKIALFTQALCVGEREKILSSQLSEF